jgi:hypothetical protein
MRCSCNAHARASQFQVAGVLIGSCTRHPIVVIPTRQSHKSLFPGCGCWCRCSCYLTQPCCKYLCTYLLFLLSILLSPPSTLSPSLLREQLFLLLSPRAPPTPISAAIDRLDNWLKSGAEPKLGFASCSGSIASLPPSHSQSLTDHILFLNLVAAQNGFFLLPPLPRHTIYTTILYELPSSSIDEPQSGSLIGGVTQSHVLTICTCGDLDSAARQSPPSSPWTRLPLRE